MEQYRQTLKRRIAVRVVFGLVAVALVALSLILTLNDFPGDDGTYWDGFVRGVTLGIFAAFCLFTIVDIVRYARALNNEEKLRALYVKENDELQKTISQKALGSSFYFTAGALIVGLTVASRYNTLVALVLTAAVIVHVLGGSVLQLYYRKHYT